MEWFWSLFDVATQGKYVDLTARPGRGMKRRAVRVVEDGKKTNGVEGGDDASDVEDGERVSGFDDEGASVRRERCGTRAGGFSSDMGSFYGLLANEVPSVPRTPGGRPVIIRYTPVTLVPQIFHLINPDGLTAVANNPAHWTVTSKLGYLVIPSSRKLAIIVRYVYPK